MKQKRYSEETKMELVRSFLKRRDEEGISMRQFAGENNIPYYTFRDFYRDPKYNPEWENRYEYSLQDNPSARMRRNRSRNV